MAAEPIPNLDRENLVRLGWYLGPAGIALGVAGMCWMLIKDLNRRTAFLLCAGLFFSLFYLWRIQANPHQIYAMRRYVPVVLPFFIIAAAYLINWLFFNLHGKARWFVSIGLTLVWFSGILFSARGFVSQVDYQGIISQLDRFNANLPANSVLSLRRCCPIGIGDMLGTPLRFLYGHDVFSLRDQDSLNTVRFAETIRDWQRAGRHVYWIGVTRRSCMAGTRPYTRIADELPVRYDDFGACLRPQAHCAGRRKLADLPG